MRMPSNDRPKSSVNATRSSATMKNTRRLFPAGPLAPDFESVAISYFPWRRDDYAGTNYLYLDSSCKMIGTLVNTET
jgi:hypothetical protein